MTNQTPHIKTRARFKTPEDAFKSGYFWAVVVNTGGRTDKDGEIIGFYKTKAGADRRAQGMEYAVLKTEYME